MSRQQKPTKFFANITNRGLVVHAYPPANKMCLSGTARIPASEGDFLSRKGETVRVSVLNVEMRIRACRFCWEMMYG